jgi:hypothetical protein
MRWSCLKIPCHCVPDLRFHMRKTLWTGVYRAPPTGESHGCDSAPGHTHLSRQAEVGVRSGLLGSLCLAGSGGCFRRPPRRPDRTPPRPSTNPDAAPTPRLAPRWTPLSRLDGRRHMYPGWATSSRSGLCRVVLFLAMLLFGAACAAVWPAQPGFASHPDLRAADRRVPAPGRHDGWRSATRVASTSRSATMSCGSRPRTASWAWIRPRTWSSMKSPWRDHSTWTSGVTHSG